VVCPAHLVGKWQDDTERFLGRTLKRITADTVREQILELSDHPFWVVSLQLAAANPRVREAIDPDRAEIFLLRASAERALERYDDAARDITRALELRTEWPDALLERANLNALRGRLEEARRDWLKIAGNWPEHPAAEAARANLAGLDGGADEPIGKNGAPKGPTAVQPSGPTSVESPTAPRAARHSSRTAGSGSDLP
ncbi:MAG: hypothetical protein D6757_09615, partial [Alphaproteobacteria bacterium]